MRSHQILILSLFFSSCTCGYKNYSCKKDYQGTFKMKMSYFTDSSISDFVKRRHWDTVLLIATADGEYSFKTNDPRLKVAEGQWSVEGDEIDGNCFGYIKQNNLRQPVGIGPYIISLADSINFSMQFVKVGE